MINGLFGTDALRPFRRGKEACYKPCDSKERVNLR